ncbi:MAG: hypothetical protein APF84_05885 [Gracilibacter sp. BRH_c7a]|nr:MAG: hypothetical protein APF84_05885 [Gracilibacter sp. BRH_c7a]
MGGIKVGNKLIELQKTLKEKGILISFSGRFSQGIIEELGDAIKKHMETEDLPRNDIYNVFAIFVEQTQNIKNYTAKKLDTIHYDSIVNSGIVTIGKKEEGYFISSGNLIENKDVEALAERINRISALDKSELKNLYKEQMKRELEQGSMGAGVGLIDIARKASNPVSYSINKVDDLLSFFTITVIV